jgi:hypothetical protein
MLYDCMDRWLICGIGPPAGYGLLGPGGLTIQQTAETISTHDGLHQICHEEQQHTLLY